MKKRKQNNVDEEFETCFDELILEERVREVARELNLKEDDSLRSFCRDLIKREKTYSSYENNIGVDTVEEDKKEITISLSSDLYNSFSEICSGAMKSQDMLITQLIWNFVSRKKIESLEDGLLRDLE